MQTRDGLSLCDYIIFNGRPRFSSIHLSPSEQSPTYQTYKKKKHLYTPPHKYMPRQYFVPPPPTPPGLISRYITRSLHEFVCVYLDKAPPTQLHVHVHVVVSHSPELKIDVGGRW